MQTEMYRRLPKKRTYPLHIFSFCNTWNFSVRKTCTMHAHPGPPTDSGGEISPQTMGKDPFLSLIIVETLYNCNQKIKRTPLTRCPLFIRAREDSNSRHLGP